MRIWNLKNRQIEAILLDNTPAYFIEISSDNKYIVSAHDDAGLKIWNIQEKVLENIIDTYSSNISCVEISNGNEYIVSAYYKFAIWIWNFLDKIPDAFYIYNSENNLFAITNDSKYLAYCGSNHHLILWSLEDNTAEADFKGHTHRISWIAMTYDSKYTISSSKDNTLRLWNIQDKIIEAILCLELFRIPIILIIHQNRYINLTLSTRI